jgi:hypothetical protein
MLTLTVFFTSSHETGAVLKILWRSCSCASSVDGTCIRKGGGGASAHVAQSPVPLGGEEGEVEQ